MQLAELTIYIGREIQESIAIKAELACQTSEQIAEAASVIVTCLQAGGKLIAFGNGGSAADAQHISAEVRWALSLGKNSPVES